MTKPKLTPLQRADILAREHWAWFGDIMEKVYKDAFIHGYKHGVEDERVCTRISKK